MCRKNLKLGIDNRSKVVYNASNKQKILPQNLAEKGEKQMSKDRAKNEMSEVTEEDIEALRFYLEMGQKSRPHSTKELPATVGLRKSALYGDKTNTDRKVVKEGKFAHKMGRMEKTIDRLVGQADEAYEAGDIERAGELLHNAAAIEDRMYGNDEWQEKVDTRRAKARRNARAKREEDERKFNAEVEATWGQEEGEYETLAEAEEARAEEERREQEQAQHDKEYEQWYNENVADGKSK